jgi:bifunctional non-homologous end joining protein LigD
VLNNGFRTLLRIERSRVRAFSRGGHDWSHKYGRIIETCSKLKCRSALIDGEVIVQNKIGLSLGGREVLRVRLGFSCT